MAIRLEVRRTKLRARRPPMHDINVTPMVDVMLVLLVIFMITAPLLTVGVPVDLPRASAPNLRGSDEPLAITIDARGRIFLQETEIKAEELAPYVERALTKIPPLDSAPTVAPIESYPVLMQKLGVARSETGLLDSMRATLIWHLSGRWFCNSRAPAGFGRDAPAADTRDARRREAEGISARRSRGGKNCGPRARGEPRGQRGPGARSKASGRSGPHGGGPAGRGTVRVTPPA